MTKKIKCCFTICFIQQTFIAAQRRDVKLEPPRRLRSGEGNHEIERKEQLKSRDVIEFLSFENNVWNRQKRSTMSITYVPKKNVILEWNDVSMHVAIMDYTKPKIPSCSLAPPANALQIAKAHLAMYDALGSVLDNGRDPYLLYADISNYEDVSYESAVATAAHQMLLNSYPAQESTLNDAYKATLTRLRDSLSGIAIANGQAVGDTIVEAYIRNRTNDHSCPINMTYAWRNTTGQHQPDPTNPNQGIVAPNYGDVNVLVKTSSRIDLQPPPKLDSEKYAFVFDQVKRLGGDNITTPTDRSWQESVAAWYYAFDGAPYLGSPSVMMNLVVREVMNIVLEKDKRMIREKEDSTITAAYILAQMHAAMADAGILTWKQKYMYNFWRPISGIRNAGSDGNDMTTPDLGWTFLGAPRSNPLSPGQKNFDPAFPSHSSGHASFCSAAMKSLGNILQTNKVEFEFTSWEWNGTTTDELGIVRPKLYQRFDSLSEFAAFCGASRVWSGVHWCTDCQSGHHIGCMAADSVYENSMRWKQKSGKKNLPAIDLEIEPQEEVLIYLDRKKKLNYFIDGKAEEEVKQIVEEYFTKRKAQKNLVQTASFSATKDTEKSQENSVQISDISEKTNHVYY